MRRIRVAILAGGWSSEREVSLKSGAAVYDALDRKKYDVTMYDPRDNLEALFQKRDKIDIAFILLHGQYGEDGRIQGLLDILGVPFAGSGVLACAMALNKKISKAQYRSVGITVAKDIIIEKDNAYLVSEILQNIGSKVIVKPVSEGSSMGISICDGEEEIMKGISNAFNFDREVMVEEYIDGKEITCGILGFNKLETLPLIEIVPNAKYDFFDYEAKYTNGATDEICPAKVSEEIAEKAREYARTAHLALGCSLWSRTDMIVNGDTINVLETNTIPGMTENSLFPLAARKAGMSLSRLADRMIELSLENRQK
ncbi:D-alanine--D-alanine ligase [Thermodesulfobacteriota bacterium]